MKALFPYAIFFILFILLGLIRNMSFLKLINKNHTSRHHNPALQELATPRKGTRYQSAFAVTTSTASGSQPSPFIQRSQSQAEHKISKFQQLQQRFKEVKARQKRRVEYTGGISRCNMEQDGIKSKKVSSETEQLSDSKVVYHVSYSNYIDSKMEIPSRKKALLFMHLDQVARNIATPIKLEQKYLTPQSVHKSHNLKDFQACLTQVQQDKDKYHSEEQPIRYAVKKSQVEQVQSNRARPRALWRREASEIISKSKQSIKALKPWGAEDEDCPIAHRHKKKFKYEKGDDIYHCF